MDAYMAASAKSQVPTSECSQRLTPEEIAQAKSDFRQGRAHMNQVSFIPVYSSKSVCHKFPKLKSECENKSENEGTERKILPTYSPPVRPRCAGNSDILAARIAKTHLRRRSVGFEDMTSLTSYYGHNFTNDRRFQSSVNNSNIPHPSPENHSTFLHSDNTQPIRKLNQSGNTSFTSWNHNDQLASGENANDQLVRNEKPPQRHKDKSSKRKSSLNRMDFIHFSSSNTGSSQYPTDLSQNNSSSDEGSECKTHLRKSDSPSGTSKRKHSTSNTTTTAKSEVKTHEVTLNNISPSKVKSNILPKFSQPNHVNSRLTRWKNSSRVCFSQKLSHSAGELESLRDISEVPSRNKTYLSAQEYDDQECSRLTFSPGTSHKVEAKQNVLLRQTQISEDSCDISSQIDNKNESTNNDPSLICVENSSNDLVSASGSSDTSKFCDQKQANKSHTEQSNHCSDSTNSDMKLNCDETKKCDDELEASTVKLETLEIVENNSKTTDLYVSSDEIGDIIGSDGERRPSILRKKSFEEKRELHSILKPTPEDKSSKTPPSILKHRESSEEKETWQPNDLHSILKKSTSEDESCNSGPDIRPILKLSTDEDSPSGILRPRPILKKRTSFSDECSYVSFPSGELKPILKKKTPLSSEDQPKPILKSRRKSEDSRSMSEVITSRPRAYSADMGIQMSSESQTEYFDIKKDLRKVESHDL